MLGQPCVASQQCFCTLLSATAGAQLTRIHVADDERLDTLLDGLARRAPDPVPLQDANVQRGCGEAPSGSPRSGVHAPCPRPHRACGRRPRSAAAVLASELQRLGGRLGALDARSRSARRGAQKGNGALPALDL